MLCETFVTMFIVAYELSQGATKAETDSYFSSTYRQLLRFWPDLVKFHNMCLCWGYILTPAEDNYANSNIDMVLWGIEAQGPKNPKSPFSQFLNSNWT